MKKIISVILAVVMIFSAYGVCNASERSDKIQSVVDSLNARSASNRKSMFSALAPLLMTNVGLNSLEYYINDYNPDSSSIFDVMVGKVLSFTDKETALSLLGYFRLVDEGIREDYIYGFQKRKERKLSSRADEALNSILNEKYKKYDGLEKLFEEDGINSGVIARLLEVPYKMNDSKPMLKDGENGFAILNVSDSLKNTIDEALKEKPVGDMTNSDDFIEAFLNLINSANENEKDNLKIVLGEIGLYKSSKPAADSGSSSGGGGSSGQSGTVTADPKAPDKDGNVVSYEIIEHDDKNGYDIVGIYRYLNGEKTDAVIENELVSIKVSSPYVMLYKIDEDKLIPVRYTVYRDGELRCIVNENGKYALKTVEKYFDDNNGWGSDYIEALYQRGIISGKGEKIFAPDDNITREEFVKLIVETIGIETKDEKSGFSDAEDGMWYDRYIAAGHKNGLINGIGDGKFGVGNNITRQDMSKILFETLIKMNISTDGNSNGKIFVDTDKIASYAIDAVKVLSSMDVLSGDEYGNFNPENNATRQEAAKLIYKMLELYIG